jgi:hypothetical protein
MDRRLQNAKKDFGFANYRLASQVPQAQWLQHKALSVRKSLCSNGH